MKEIINQILPYLGNLLPWITAIGLGVAILGLLYRMRSYILQVKTFERSEEQRKENEFEREKQIKESLRVKSKNSQRTIDSEIFYFLSPGKSIESMKDILGVANVISNEDYPVFEDEFINPRQVIEDSKIEVENKTNSYLYLFKNASVKVTSKNNKSVDSLTVINYDEDLDFEYLLFSWGNDENGRFGKTKVSKDMVENCDRHTLIQTRIDNSFVLTFNTPAPTYFTYTYFGFCYKHSSYHKEQNPIEFINSFIDGVCISKSENDIYYIYDSEMV